VLIGIRCLDEGVDVPEARQAYLLASSGNPREFVQRRGRLLRLAPGKQRSEISDLVAIPTDTEGFDGELVRKEFRRVLAFAEAAENGPEAVESLRRQLGRDESWTDLGGG
jgi:superfamily II DNA or RNA helicase